MSEGDPVARGEKSRFSEPLSCRCAFFGKKRSAKIRKLKLVESQKGKKFIIGRVKISVGSGLLQTSVSGILNN